MDSFSKFTGIKNVSDKFLVSKTKASPAESIEAPIPTVTNTLAVVSKTIASANSIVAASDVAVSSSNGSVVLTEQRYNFMDEFNRIAKIGSKYWQHQGHFFEHEVAMAMLMIDNNVKNAYSFSTGLDFSRIPEFLNEVNTTGPNGLKYEFIVTGRYISKTKIDLSRTREEITDEPFPDWHTYDSADNDSDTYIQVIGHFGMIPVHSESAPISKKSFMEDRLKFYNYFLTAVGVDKSQIHYQFHTCNCELENFEKRLTKMVKSNRIPEDQTLTYIRNNAYSVKEFLSINGYFNYIDVETGARVSYKKDFVKNIEKFNFKFWKELMLYQESKC